VRTVKQNWIQARRQQQCALACHSRPLTQKAQAG
jgi:hypothetical protein